MQGNLDEEFLLRVRELWSASLREGISEIFENFVRTDELRDSLIEIAINWTCKAVTSMNDGDSGLVVAGYGGDDVYPCLRSFKIERIVADRLIYVRQFEYDVAERGASIIPFAQIDVVHTFMEGVDQDYQSLIDEAVVSTLRALGNAAVAGSGKKGASRKEFADTIGQLADDAGQRFKDLAHKYRMEQFAEPTVSVVAILPKDRLAAMAEALVNITVLRRQFSMTEETVGGPIDVAVISKGDGLVWIKRKHYFEKHLNPQFFHNYFLEG